MKFGWLLLFTLACQSVPSEERLQRAHSDDPGNGTLARFALALPGAKTTPTPVSIDVDLASIFQANLLDPSAIGTTPLAIALVAEDGTTADAAFQLDPAGKADDPTWHLTFLLPAGSTFAHADLRTAPSGRSAVQTAPLSVEDDGTRVTAATTGLTVTFDRSLGGFPTRVSDGVRDLTAFTWNDRIYKSERSDTEGLLMLTRAPADATEIIARGPLRFAWRTTATYRNSAGQPATSGALAHYTFEVFAGVPLVAISAAIEQRAAVAWDELHVGELHFSDREFDRWLIGTPPAADALTDSMRYVSGSDFAAFTRARTVLGVLSSAVSIYDGLTGYGEYLHGPWMPWNGRALTAPPLSITLVEDDDAGARLADLRLAANQSSSVAATSFTIPAIDARLAHLDALAAFTLSGHAHKSYEALAGALRSLRAMRPLPTPDLLAALTTLEASVARGEDARQTLPWFGRTGTGLRCLANEAQSLCFYMTNHGATLLAHHDYAAATELVAEGGGPLIAADLTTGTATRALSTSGFSQVTLAGTAESFDLTLACPQPETPPCATALTLHGSMTGRQVHLMVQLAAPRAAQRLVFPIYRARALPNAIVHYPLGAGVARHASDVASAPYRATYPSSLASYQLLGTYSPATGGVFVATLDPFGSSKELHADASASDVTLQAEWPLPQDGAADFTLPGEVVLGLHDGDWHEPAAYYRAWAEQAPAWRRTEPLPQALNDVDFWLQGSGDDPAQADRIVSLVAQMKVPTAVHWYNWEQAAFDTNYPHYFPARPGFATIVERLHGAGIRVMPYVNGRLWDTAASDFAAAGRPAAAKSETGDIYREDYGSGTSLAPMCPTTPLWQATVANVALQLVSDFGVDGVYLDQLAAAAPAPCFDASHGHPLGGGHYWVTDGYLQLLSALRKRLPPSVFLTSEGNAESYNSGIDGVLGWHFQYQDQVPIFASIYNRHMAVFGRAHKDGGADFARAIMMRTGQQLVFGEQIGWIAADTLVAQPVALAFMQKAVQLRHAWRDFLRTGTLLGDPSLLGAIPNVTADWHWDGVWPVTMSALARTAWRHPDGRVVVLLANVSEQPVSATLDPRSIGFVPADVVGSWDESGPVATQTNGSVLAVDMAASSVRAILARPAR
jgi:hypothetical protein